MTNALKTLVLDDVRDRAHGAFFHAVAACDAQIVVHDIGNAADDFQNAFFAAVNANAATNALVSIDNRMGQDTLLSLGNDSP